MSLRHYVHHSLHLAVAGFADMLQGRDRQRVGPGEGEGDKIAGEELVSAIAEEVEGRQQLGCVLRLLACYHWRLDALERRVHGERHGPDDEPFRSADRAGHERGHRLLGIANAHFSVVSSGVCGFSSGVCEFRVDVWEF